MLFIKGAVSASFVKIMMVNLKQMYDANWSPIAPKKGISSNTAENWCK